MDPELLADLRAERPDLTAVGADTSLGMLEELAEYTEEDRRLRVVCADAAERGFHRRTAGIR